MSDLPPYAEAMGIAIERWEDGVPILACDYSNDVCGNPGTFQGGALGGILETAAIMALKAGLPEGTDAGCLSPLNLTVEFLRTAGAQRIYASARVIRAGRRLANVRAEAWQADRSKPVATAFVNVALVRA